MSTERDQRLPLHQVPIGNGHMTDTAWDKSTRVKAFLTAGGYPFK